MIYILDKETGDKYKVVSMSLKKLMLIRLLLPVSYVLYGLIVAFILTIIGFSDKLSLILLAVAYIVNIPLSVSKKQRSFIDILYSFLAAPILDSMLVLVNPQTKKERINEILIRGIEQVSTDKMLKLCEKFDRRFHLN